MPKDINLLNKIRQQHLSLGLLGGTFDPIHLGHTYIAKAVQEKLHLDKIFFIPCHIPPHRETPGATAEHRLAMVELATHDEPAFDIDLRELQANRPSYSYLTLQEIRKDLPDTPITFILGSDSFQSLNTWEEWQDFPKWVNIAVVCRAGHPLKKQDWMINYLKQYETANAELFTQDKCGHIIILDLPPKDISATNIRQKISDTSDIENLVNEDVEKYINKHQLYSQKSQSKP